MIRGPKHPQHLPKTATVPLADLLDPHFQAAAPNACGTPLRRVTSRARGKGHYLHTHCGRLINEKSPITWNKVRENNSPRRKRNGSPHPDLH